MQDSARSKLIKALSGVIGLFRKRSPPAAPGEDPYSYVMAPKNPGHPKEALLQLRIYLKSDGIAAFNDAASRIVEYMTDGLVCRVPGFRTWVESPSSSGISASRRGSVVLRQESYSSRNPRPKIRTRGTRI